MGRLEESETCYRRALELSPARRTTTSATSSRPWPHPRGRGRLSAAVGVEPDYADVHNNLALALLLRGRFEARLRASTSGAGSSRTQAARPIRSRSGTAHPLAGPHDPAPSRAGTRRHDPVRSLRRLVKERRRDRPVSTVPGRCCRSCATCPGIDAWFPWTHRRRHFDVHAPLLSLPRLFGTTVRHDPGPVPYLAADPRLVDRWRERLPACPGFKVGIVWQGNPKPRGQPPFGAAQRCSSRWRGSPAFASSACRWATARSNWRHWGVRTALPRDRPGQPASIRRAFSDAAAVLSNLDLVVTVDTAVAHLAGRWACRCGWLLPFAPDWRWLLDREDSPWYPTMRLFRQPRPGEWSEVFARVTRELSVVSSQWSVAKTLLTITTVRVSPPRPTASTGLARWGDDWPARIRRRGRCWSLAGLSQSVGRTDRLMAENRSRTGL